jgi:predicted metal-dependent HD superfamily phosphohydrolase
MINLRHAYADAIAQLGQHQDQVDFLFDDLKEKYNGQTRDYHNIGHIGRTLSYLDDLIHRSGYVIGKPKIAMMQLAIFYHDAVYVPGASFNEAMSTNYFTMHNRYIGVSTEVMLDIVEIIEATAHHQPSDFFARLVCGADLYELGTEYYSQNRMAIWREYGQPQGQAWKDGRSAFLNKYLNYNRLFLTPGTDHLEKLAREQMETELSELTGQ